MKATKWYFELFRRLLTVAIHNAMVMYQSLPNNKNIDSLNSGFHYHKASWKSTVLVFLILYVAVHQLSRHLKDSKNDISWSVFLPPERRQNLKEYVWCARNMGKGENLFIGAVNLKQGCV
jgi:hypothetical protein